MTRSGVPALQLSFGILLLLYCFLLVFYCFLLVFYCCCTGFVLVWYWAETGQRLVGSQLPLARHAVLPVAVWIAFRSRVDAGVNFVSTRQDILDALVPDCDIIRF